MSKIKYLRTSVNNLYCIRTTEVQSKQKMFATRAGCSFNCLHKTKKKDKIVRKTLYKNIFKKITLHFCRKCLQIIAKDNFSVL